MVGSDPKARQRQMVTCTTKFPLTAPTPGSRRRQHDGLATNHAIGAWHGQPPTTETATAILGTALAAVLTVPVLQLGYHRAKPPPAWTFVRTSMPNGNLDGHSQAKMVAKVVVDVKNIISERSVTKTAKSAPRELQRYQTPIAPEIEGMDPLEKFNPPKFTLYDGKSNLRSFYQLTESFVAQYVINTKAPKGVNSLLTLRKGKIKTLRNYSKRYWELYNEIEYLEELVTVNYKLRQTPNKKLWEDLMLNPPADPP
ncbi:hypothetical protein Acr_28g0003880 [Actinidia rufa]|uniref:Uncharacterized protein n=1 Tax=Actinidia rufa TaxID=165716 RepID=A0A7J0H991_9ERIC|nr:hypothetical protein Acr_28g0003880 [Actinidia rufa]